MTLAHDKEGRPTPEAAEEYFKYKQMMTELIRQEDADRRAQEMQKQELLAFDQREIPITDEDVYRVGGTLTYNTVQTESIDEEDY
jgi:predicted phosphatase